MAKSVLRLSAVWLGLLAGPGRAADGPSAAGGPFPAAVADAIARIDAGHRAVVRGPVEGWQLAPIRAGYEALARSANDPVVTSAVQARLDVVARHEAVARSARSVQTLLDKSRRRDAEVESARRSVARASRPQSRPFAAKGLLQPSSREVDGRRVFALVGAEGSTLAYLDVPPGLDTGRVLTRRVGVRGSVRFNESLGARVIAVRDLEPLE